MSEEKQGATLKLLSRGRKYVNSLNLMRGSKKQEKICPIPDRWEENPLDGKPMWDDKLGLSLHQRLGLTLHCLHKENGGPINLAVANIGFVISDIPWKQGGPHKRVFITIPLVDGKWEIIGKGSEHKHKIPTYSRTHSESGLINHLHRNVPLIVNTLLTKYQGHKIYSVILDIHSTQCVCESCVVDLMELQCEYKEGSFLYKLQSALHSKFPLPKKPLNEQYISIKNPDESSEIMQVSKKQKTSFEFYPGVPYLQLVIRATGFRGRDQEGGGLDGYSSISETDPAPKPFSKYETSSYYTKSEVLLAGSDVYLLSKLPSGNRRLECDFGGKYCDSYIFIADINKFYHVNKTNRIKEYKIENPTEFQELCKQYIPDDPDKPHAQFPLQIRLTNEAFQKFLFFISSQDPSSKKGADYYDIRKHQRGVILHMVPAYYAQHKEIAYKDKEFYKEKLRTLSIYGFFNLCRQTAFANTNGGNHEKERKEKVDIDALRGIECAEILHKSLMPSNNGP